MAQLKKYKVKRNISLIPNGLVNPTSKMALPPSVPIKAGTIIMASEQNGRLQFTYGSFVFDKEYDTQSNFGKMNRRDIVLEGSATAFTPGKPPVVSGSQSQNTGVVPQDKGGSVVPSQNTSEQSQQPTQVEKSATTKSMFEFKDKLHAGITFVATAFGVYYAYKTKGKVKDYLMYGGGGLVLGFVLGNLASSYVSTPKASEKSATQSARESGKPLDSKPNTSTTTQDTKSQGVETDEIKPTMESFM